MKILGKLSRDYYDSGAMYGIDETHILLRNPKSILIDADYIWLSMGSYGESRSSRTYKRTSEYMSKDGKTRYDIKMKTLFFCGEIYPVYAITPYQEFNGVYYDQPEVHVCTTEEFVKYTENFKKPMTEIEVAIDFTSAYLYDTLARRASDELKQKEVLTEYSKKNGLPYFLVEVMNRRVSVETWPHLGTLGFGRIKDQVTCFNEIDFYMFSVLQHDKETIEIQDKDKIVKKGFDPEYGFRTRSKKVKKC